ncbi:MAG TPA: hypothetical protein VNT92_08555 [Acidimicrobiia bacterium]|nr:hypothetical protein [Acidimicrobiia bacterium]
MRAIRVIVAAVPLLVIACGPDPEVTALAQSACQTLEQVQGESEPDQLAAYNDWFDANQSEINSVAMFGGSADYEAALLEECGPVVEPFAVAYEAETGVSFWQSSSAP